MTCNKNTSEINLWSNTQVYTACNGLQPHPHPPPLPLYLGFCSFIIFRKYFPLKDSLNVLYLQMRKILL